MVDRLDEKDLNALHNESGKEVKGLETSGLAKRSLNLWNRWKAIAQFLFLGLIFGIGYTQDPIYNSPENQNTKYFHALARAGHGFLNEDWLASTRDPLPAFTALVQFTYTFLHQEYLFYVYYILIFGLYLYSLKGVVSAVLPLERHHTRTVIFLALFFFIHIVHIDIFNIDTGRDLHTGVAQQYILGPVFQPANFGAFILLSIHLFLKRRPFWAVGMLAIAVTMHPTYFPSVGILTLLYLTVVGWQDTQKQAFSVVRLFRLGALATILMLPVFLYMVLAFQDTSPEFAQQATDLIVNQRIPHHSIPQVWLANGRAYVQAGIVAIALWVIRKHTLVVLLAIPFVLAVGLTALQMYMDSDTLAFIAPWRMSVFLVPIATSILLGQGAIALSSLIPPGHSAQRITSGICVGIITAVVISGGMEQVQKFRTQDDTIPMLTFVQETAQSGDVYLVPPDARELRKFRLYTGAAIFTNRKSHPYLDTEVLEWGQRWNLAQQFYASQPRPQQCRLLNRTLVKTYNVTHVVVPLQGLDRPCQGFTEVYRDTAYRVDILTRKNRDR
ncbi:MAG: hypothetical protein F6K09_08605 [Merismopedia sp. SIO2A8]|nr:hypothetical protein [Symploca sp. SIO2B6]NET48771.1 hypothetical protein [Merismopedia sp. SIO2A8]